MLDPIIFGLMIGAFLFCTGILIGIELMLNGANVNLVVFSGSDPNIQGQLMGIFVVVLAAAESVVALAIMLNIFRHFQTLDLNSLKKLKH
jgi:NADH:ubiquinone oxidoreductase subunit K